MQFSQHTLHAFTAVATADQENGDECVYCKRPLDVINHDENQVDVGFTKTEIWKQKLCPSCRWWTLDYHSYLPHEDGIAEDHGHAFAVLREFHIDGIDTPVEELRRYLTDRFEARFDIHPRKLEEILASIFREHGFRVELTAYTKDGGVDLFLLRSPREGWIAVQVKRNKESMKIGVEEIDRFLGVILRHDLYRGIFVTTSSYTKGAIRNCSAHSLLRRGYFLELWDSKKLLEAMRPEHEPLSRSADVAWAMRHAMPIAQEIIGDYAPFHPKQSPAETDVANWTSKVSKSCSTHAKHRKWWHFWG